MATVKSIAKSLIKSVEEKLKILSKIKGERIDTADINPEDVKRMAELKSEMDSIQIKLKTMNEEYQTIRQQVIDQLPGKEEDVVDVIIDGVRIHKYPRNTMAGKLLEDKVLELAKSKRLLGKFAPLKRVINKQAVIEALAEEKITYDEYLQCTTQNIVPVVDIEFLMIKSEEEQESSIQVAK